MLKLLENKQFVIYDDVLNQEEFEHVGNYIQNEKYVIPHVAGWDRVWKITDSIPLGGPPYYKTKMPFKNALDIIAHYIIKISESHKDQIGEYEELTLRSYLYPIGTKLSWHNDKGYKAAVIFYAHKDWKINWGGELMIAHGPNNIENSLEKFGLGHYIFAKPNRLVFTFNGVWHSINRVDQNAGDNVRSTIVGFFS
jgi:Rps23 Pro-64 3,4-dihydroxylase Tpa1-like proline 4-hydroxylase